MKGKSVPTLGLALSGGTTLGSAHVGVLEAFAEQGISIDCISGTSAGALVGACFAFGVPLSRLKELTQEMNWKKLSRFGYSKLGLNSNEPIGEFITDLLGNVQIEDAKIPLAIVATNIETHAMVILRSGSLREAIRATTCIPGFFIPVTIHGDLLVDGGLTENVPLSALEEMGATIKIGVNLFAHPETKRPQNMFDVMSASLTILGQHRDRSLQERSDILIEPDLHTFDSSKFKDIERIVAEGYTATMTYMPAIKAKISVYKEKKESIFRKILSFFQS